MNLWSFLRMRGAPSRHCVASRPQVRSSAGAIELLEGCAALSHSAATACSVAAAAAPAAELAELGCPPSASEVLQPWCARISLRRGLDVHVGTYLRINLPAGPTLSILHEAHGVGDARNTCTTQAWCMAAAVKHAPICDSSAPLKSLGP